MKAQLYILSVPYLPELAALLDARSTGWMIDGLSERKTKKDVLISFLGNERDSLSISYLSLPKMRGFGLFLAEKGIKRRAYGFRCHPSAAYP
jgi:hypothetical protein